MNNISFESTLGSPPYPLKWYVDAGYLVIQSSFQDAEKQDCSSLHHCKIGRIDSMSFNTPQLTDGIKRQGNITISLSNGHNHMIWFPKDKVNEAFGFYNNLLAVCRGQ